MFAGTRHDFQAFAQVPSDAERSPAGFYRTGSSEIWPEIDPHLMTREELDKEIKAGIQLYQKYFPPDDDGFGLFVAVIAVVAIAAVAVYAAGTAAAAGGAGQAAAQGAAASSAASTASASSALAVGTGSSPAIAAGAAGSTTTSMGAAAAFGKQAFSVAKSAAPYVKGAATVAKAGGNDEADKFIKGASIIENSSSATDAAEAVFKNELQKRGMKYDEKKRAALRERIRKEQGAYAAWQRRYAQRQKQMNPSVQTSGQSEMIKWLPIATPFVLYALTQG